MSENPKTYPLAFDCYKCKHRSQYPNYLNPDHEADAEPEYVIKRCLNCGSENRVSIPPGFKSNVKTEIQRGGQLT